MFSSSDEESDNDHESSNASSIAADDRDESVPRRASPVTNPTEQCVCSKLKGSEDNSE